MLLGKCLASEVAMDEATTEDMTYTCKALQRQELQWPQMEASMKKMTDRVRKITYKTEGQTTIS